jgi:hypothetical protein
MKNFSVFLEIIEWAAKSDFAEELLDYIVAEARKWAQDDGKEDWDDILVDALEMVAKYFFAKYQKS